jgi:selenocysteine lyase/cysteine desulfurase
MLPIDCHDYAVDFLAGAGHKWLCGGPGTGVLYVRYSGSAPLAPWSGGNWPSYGNLFVDPSVRFNNRNWAPTAIQGRGETNTPALYAMSDSADLFFNVGIRNIYDRGVALAQYLQGKARARWGQEAVTVQSPDPAFKTFLSSINPYVGRNDPAQFSTINAAINRVLAALAAETPKIYIRSVTWHSVGNRGAADDLCAFRISTHAMYNNYAEIDWMFDRLAYHVEAQGLAVMHP